MAVYEYEVLGPDGTVRGIYEAEQRMSDEALTHHPQTGEPLRRILSRTFGRTASSEVGGSQSPTGPCSTGLCGGEGFGGCCAGGECGVN